jgi:hypothetical protein
MIRKVRTLAGIIAVVGLVAANGYAFAPPDDKGPNTKGQAGPSKGKKEHKDYSGKALLGDNIKKNGSHKLQDHGKYSASVDVSHGKITGMKVNHADKGAVPVTKYKTTKNMAQAPTSGIQFASYFQAQSQYIGTLWIGYGYIDEWGDEYIYWFPYDMIYDGDTGAIEYYPSY